MYFKNINPLENMHGFQTSIFDMDFVFFKKKKRRGSILPSSILLMILLSSIDDVRITIIIFIDFL
jgi:hypothetical protein